MERKGEDEHGVPFRETLVVDRRNLIPLVMMKTSTLAQGFAAIVTLASLALGCGDSNGTLPSDAGPESDAANDARAIDAGPIIDLSEAMFDPAVVLQIEITLAQQDWDALRIQGRSVTDLVGPSCLEEPLFRIYDYFSATVTIDGTELTDVGVRKKGLIGSLSPTKPSLKLKFDEYTPGQTHSGLSRFTLNNARSDRGYVNQCLGYQLFAAAGIPSPRCNYANVTLNGENLGLYVHVEGIKKPFLRRHFSDDEGNLYEGTLSDFRSDLQQTFQRKTNKLDQNRSDLTTVVTAVETATDAELLSALPDVIDVDQFMTFWAMESLLGHSDGYGGNTNNFYVYSDPTSGVFHFLPWGIDSIFSGSGVPPANGAIARRFASYQPTLDTFAARVSELLDEVWNEPALLAEVTRMETLLRPYLTAADDGFDDRLSEVRDFISNRRASFMLSPPVGTEPLRPVPCLDVYGTINANFVTTFNTLGQDPLALGSGSASGTLFGNPIEVTTVGAVAGFGGQDGIEATTGLLINLTDGSSLVILADTPSPQFLPGDVTLDYAGVFATLFTLDMGNFVPIGLIANGSVRFDSASTADGAAIVGSISGTIYDTFPDL